MICDWEKVGDSWRCNRCRRSRSWPGPGAPPARQCGTAPLAVPRADSTDCIHRGDVVRTVQCASCKNSTVEVAVHHCELFGECTLRNYAARNPDLAAMHVCQGCPERKAEGGRQKAEETNAPALPSLAVRAKNFAGAVVRDRLSGKLRRSPELVARLFNDFCATCPLYNAIEGACAGCGCPVSADAAQEDNKLAWSQEKCPEGKWPIQKANLIFYLLPLRHPNKVWQWHVAQLRQRFDIFNGRRIVWIATKGPGTRLGLDDPELVIKEFGADAKSIEFVTAPNDPTHWETPAFRAMLSALYFRQPAQGGTLIDANQHSSEKGLAQISEDQCSHSEATFYFHAKGVRRAMQDAIKPWCEAIYHHNLDRWPEVKQILSVYPCAGIARQNTDPLSGPNGGAGWHFAGTGFWFNHAALFSRPNWDQIQDHSHAVEAYLSTQFPYESAYCLAHDNAGAEFGGVYRASTWLNPRAQDRPPAVRKAEGGRQKAEDTNDLELWILGHDRERLRWVTTLAHTRKIYLPDLDARNDLAESRIFHGTLIDANQSEKGLARISEDQRSPFVGLCTQSWDRKYKHHCLPLAELDQLERRPELVWAACTTQPDWIELSERDHPGMAAVLGQLAEHLGLSAADLRRPGPWSNNLICHRDVLTDLAEWHRRLLPWCLDRWGWTPPYQCDHYSSPHGGGGATRRFSFLAERLTVLYFCARRHLEVKQMPKKAEGEQKAEGKRQKAEDTRQRAPSSLLPSPLLPSAFSLASRVITAADAGYFTALQIFVSSVQETHACDLTVFDLGLGSGQLTWLSDRGVKIDNTFFARVSPAIEKPWLKAAMLAHASREGRPLLWIDADTVITGSLAPLEAIAAQKPFVTPCYAAAVYWGAGRERDCLANHELLYARHPVPARMDRHWPNTGVVACDPLRDRELLDTWLSISDQAIADPTLRHLFRFWDQGAFQWTLEKLGLVDLPAHDKRFNDCDLQGPRTLDELRAAIADKVARDDTRIIHFAGNQKPYAAFAT